MKRVLFFCLMLSFISPIEAQKKPFGNGLYWELNEGVLTISGNGAMPDAGYNESPWSKSGPIRRVIIQYGITSIGNDSFKEDYNGNHSLLSVEIPNSVKIIGDNAFSGCKKLSSVSIPNSVTTIGEGAFFSCERLTSITIPYSVNSIGEDAFLATGLSSIVIPNSVKSIGESAFAECINLKSISISESVTSIGDDAFIGDEDDKCYEGTISLLPQWLLDKGTSEWKRCGLSTKSVEAFKRTNTPDARIKRKGGYASAVELNNGKLKYYKVSKGGLYGLTNAEGKEIVPTEMEALESAGTGFLKYKINGFWGVMNYTGKIIIDTDRGYTSIGNFVTFTKRFPYTMTGYKGECDATGRQISKIKVETPQQNVASTSSSSNSNTSNNGNSKSGSSTQTVVVEHHRDPVPVQEWQACWACGGMGTMGCDNCGGSGTKYIGDRLHRCSRCNGQGLIPCNICYGNKGKYITVYR